MCLLFGNKDGQVGKVGGETEEWLRFRYFLHYAEGVRYFRIEIGLYQKVL